MSNETTFENNSQQQAASCSAVLSLLDIPQCVLEMSLRHPRTPCRSQGRSDLSGTVASGRERGWKCFSVYSRWTPAGEKQVISFFSLHQPLSRQHTESLLPLSPSLFWPQTVQLLYFHHLTHIQNCFLVGAAPETGSKPLMQLQITGWKAVTSAFGRSASHGCASSPSLGDTLFILSHTPLSCEQPSLPSHQLSYQGAGSCDAKSDATTQNLPEDWLCWNHINGIMYFSAHVSHNMTATYTDMNSIKACISAPSVLGESTIYNEDNMQNHLH